jgi:hypothetical protein
LRPDVSQPSCIRMENDYQGMTLIQRWFSFKYIPLAFFAVAWDSFLIFWYSMALHSDHVPWIMVVFPIAHVAVGIGLTYSTIAGILNRTILRVTPETISVRFEPLPWKGKKQIAVADIKQLFCKDKVTRSKNGISTQYELYAVTAANQQVKLVGRLDNSEIAIFLEQQLERWLKIEDRPVAGELPR